MKFTPQSEEEIAMAGLLEKGNYSYEVIGAESAKSKAGNDMIKLKVHIFTNDPDAAPRTTFDYLMEKMAHKLRHFCGANGLIKSYEAGELTPEMCVGKTGTCYLSINTDKDGKYPPSNSISDYLMGEGNQDMPETKGKKPNEPF